MSAREVGTSWTLVRPDRAAVIAALERGECDGLLPAASGFLDEFATFLDQHGLLAFFEHFPDARQRHSIAPEFFCQVLIYKALFRLPSLSEIGPVLFHSPDVLRRLGFNLRQIQEGFYQGSAQRPFNPEALADFFNALPPEQLQQHQLQLSAHLLRECPPLRQDGVAVLDANTVTVPAGHFHRPGVQLKACVLGLRGAGRLFPMLWDFTTRGPGEQGDLTQGRHLIAQARKAWGEGVIRRLLVDRGFSDGLWISELKTDGIDTVIGLREDMDLYEDMLGLSRLDDARWVPAPGPILHEGVLPERALCHLTDLETWSSCSVPLQGLVIRDTYPDRVQYQCLVTTDLSLGPQQLHNYARDRWSIEESFMDLTRYWYLTRLGSCRPGVARGQVHFIFLAYTLLHLYAQEAAQRDPGAPRDGAASRDTAAPRLGPRLLPGREITAYFGDHYAILLPSELVTIILDHYQAWLAHREQLLRALRFCEGEPRPRAPD